MKDNTIDTKFLKILKLSLLVLSVLGISYSIFFSFENIDNPKLINIVLLIPFIVFLTPYLVLSLYGIKKIDSKMEVMPRFLRDVVDNVDSGMDIVSSIKNTLRNEYVVLNGDIKKFANQLNWGIEFETAFLNFADNVGSFSLKRDFILIIEARKVGGHFEKILRELSEKINIDILRKKELKSNLSSTTFTGYISFVIFIFIIVLTYNSLFVGISNTLNQNSGNSGPSDNPKVSIFLSLLMFLSYELAILSGFLFGLMQENRIISGAPHVVILVVITFIGFFFFIHF